MSDGSAGQGSSGEDSVDPAFEGLFRPDDAPADSSPASTAAAEPASPQRTEPLADTGRLFRSQGVSGHDEAVLALDAGRFSRLRTLERTGDDTVVVSETDDIEPDAAAPEVAALLATEDAHTPSAPTQGDPMASRSGSRRGHRSASRRVSTSAGRGISAGAVALVVIGVTLLVGLANALLGGGSLGWPTGLALLASSVYASLTVRRDADTIAFLMPPVAFLITALTAGQFFIDANEGSLINRAAIVFFTLADNWIWIIGSTLAALIIVLVRRRSN